jgi:ABC-2 type transport system ATP-binding protein
MEQAILLFENVTGKKSKFRLQNINFEVQPGFIYGLMGANGAGKTTLMRYILDDTARYTGHIYVDGEDVHTGHAHVMNKIGFVSEDNQFLVDRTCRQNVEILGMLYENFDTGLFEDTMRQLQVSPTKTYKKMSRGEKLKFQLAFAVAHHPCLYLLDEATAGMDPVFRKEYFDMLQQLIMDETASVLMTSHISSEMETKTDYVGIMEEGKLIRFGESLDVIPALAKEGSACYEF